MQVIILYQQWLLKYDIGGNGTITIGYHQVILLLWYAVKLVIGHQAGYNTTGKL